MELDYKDNVVHFVNGSLQGPLSATTPVEVRLTSNADSWSALATTSAFLTDTWSVKKLTLNLGLRFDRYLVYLPEQQLAAGRFVPVAQTFAAVGDCRNRQSSNRVANSPIRHSLNNH